MWGPAPCTGGHGKSRPSIGRRELPLGISDNRWRDQQAGRCHQGHHGAGDPEEQGHSSCVRQSLQEAGRPLDRLRACPFRLAGLRGPPRHGCLQAPGRSHHLCARPHQRRDSQGLPQFREPSSGRWTGSATGTKRRHVAGRHGCTGTKAPQPELRLVSCERQLTAFTLARASLMCFLICARDSNT